MNDRSLLFEQLEERVALHADVNLDGKVSTADVLAIINRLQTPVVVGQFDNLDVNGDRKLTALDALIVINRIDRFRHAHPAVLTFALGPIDTYGLTHHDVMWAINEAFEEYENTANLDMQISSAGQFRISSRSLWLGGPYHARGQASGNQIWFHNGILLPGQHNGALGPIDQIAYWRAMSSPQALKQILMHEIGHVTFFGENHANSTDCVMHINASTDQFCPTERALLQSRYGRSSMTSTVALASPGIPTVPRAPSDSQTLDFAWVEDTVASREELSTQAQNRLQGNGVKPTVSDGSLSLKPGILPIEHSDKALSKLLVPPIHVRQPSIDSEAHHATGMITTLAKTFYLKVVPTTLSTEPSLTPTDHGIRLFDEAEQVHESRRPQTKIPSAAVS